MGCHSEAVEVIPVSQCLERDRDLGVAVDDVSDRNSGVIHVAATSDHSERLDASLIQAAEAWSFGTVVRKTPEEGRFVSTPYLSPLGGMTELPCGVIPPGYESHFGNVIAVGIDLTHVSAVRQSVREFGDRYLSRVFTVREWTDCTAAADPFPRLAARFAAKEATLKALRVHGPQPPWRSMEVRRNPAGWCDEVRLSRSALSLARRRGVDRILVSLTHEEDEAMAVVVAVRWTVPETG